MSLCKQETPGAPLGRTAAVWIIEEFDEAGELYAKISACNDHALNYLMGWGGYEGHGWPMTWHGERYVLTRLHPEAS